MVKVVLTEVQRKLIVDNYKLLSKYITKIIDKKDVPKFLEDEFISDTFFKFCLSALKFDEKSGFQFSTYAYGGFNFSLRYVLEHKKKKIERLYYSDDLKKYGLEYKKTDQLKINMLDDFINEIDLNLRDKSIVKDYYYEGLSLVKVGQKHNLSGEAVRLIIKKVLKKMRITATRKKMNIEDFYK